MPIYGPCKVHLLDWGIMSWSVSECNVASLHFYDRLPIPLHLHVLVSPVNILDHFRPPNLQRKGIPSFTLTWTRIFQPPFTNLSISLFVLLVLDWNIFHQWTPQVCIFTHGYATCYNTTSGAQSVKYISFLHSFILLVHWQKQNPSVSHEVYLNNWFIMHLYYNNHAYVGIIKHIQIVCMFQMQFRIPCVISN